MENIIEVEGHNMERYWIDTKTEEKFGGNSSMEQHMKVSDMPAFCSEINEWLSGRYGTEQGGQIWEATCRQYEEYLKELPDYGGKKNGHALAIYGGLLIFSLYPQLPDQPPIEELQDFVSHMFMGAFVKLGRIFDLNRKLDMRLINTVFKKC